MAEGEGSTGGKVVGKISIRVVPEMDRFRSDLQRRLDEIEKDVKCKVRIDPDLDGFRDRVDAATRNLKDAKVKVKVDYDRTENPFGHYGATPIHVKPTLDKGDLVHDLDSAVEDSSRRSKGARVRVDPRVDEVGFRKTLAEMREQAKFAGVKLNVDFKDKEAEAELEKLLGKLKAEAKMEKIELRVGERARGGGGRRGNDEGGLLGGINNAVSAGEGMVGSGMRMFGNQTMMIVAAVVALLAPALALLSTALVSLPALITAVALPLGVFALGLGGIKKALEDSGILTDTKGKGGKDKIGVGSLIKSIQEPVNAVFEKGLAPLFRQLVDAFSGAIPVLQRGLPFVAQGIVNFATGIVRAVSSVPNLQMLDRLTNSVGSMLTNLAPGITSFTSGMIRLTTDVGDHLPGLGKALAGTRIGSWRGFPRSTSREPMAPRRCWTKLSQD
jgi:hypothetical protein